jgi:hypothetical protein
VVEDSKPNTDKEAADLQNRGRNETECHNRTRLLPTRGKRREKGRGTVTNKLVGRLIVPS